MAEAEKVEEKVEETQEVVVEEQQLEEKVNSKEPPKKEDMNEDELESFQAEFDTAWSPPEAICHALRDKFPDMCISWFFDEPGMEVAGYL